MSSLHNHSVFKKVIAFIVLLSQVLTSCTTHLLPPSKEETKAINTLPLNIEDSEVEPIEEESSKGLALFTYLAKGGHEISLINRKDQWEAIVKERQFIGFRRDPLILPVKIEIGFNIVELTKHNSGWQQNHIEVLFPEQDPQGKGHVTIGTRGLPAGMKQGGGKGNCPYEANAKKWNEEKNAWTCPGGNHPRQESETTRLARERINRERAQADFSNYQQRMQREREARTGMGQDFFARSREAQRRAEARLAELHQDQERRREAERVRMEAEHQAWQERIAHEQTERVRQEEERTKREQEEKAEQEIRRRRGEEWLREGAEKLRREKEEKERERARQEEEREQAIAESHRRAEESWNKMWEKYEKQKEENRRLEEIRKQERERMLSSIKEKVRQEKAEKLRLEEEKRRKKEVKRARKEQRKRQEEEREAEERRRREEWYKNLQEDIRASVEEGERKFKLEMEQMRAEMDKIGRPATDFSSYNPLWNYKPSWDKGPEIEPTRIPSPDLTAYNLGSQPKWDDWERKTSRFVPPPPQEVILFSRDILEKLTRCSISKEEYEEMQYSKEKYLAFKEQHGMLTAEEKEERKKLVATEKAEANPQEKPANSGEQKETEVEKKVEAASEREDKKAANQAQKVQKQPEEEAQQSTPVVKEKTEKEKELSSDEEGDSYEQESDEQETKDEKDDTKVTLENAVTEVKAYLQAVETGILSPEEQKAQGQELLKQIEALKKREKRIFRWCNRLDILDSDFDAITAQICKEEAQMHKEQLVTLRTLRSQLTKACKLSKEELAACKIKVVESAGGNEEEYHIDSSDEEVTYLCSRGDLAFAEGTLNGILNALDHTPTRVKKDLETLLTNPLTTVEGLVTLLRQIPGLAVAALAYLDSIEGNEREKGEEMGEFVTGVVIDIIIAKVIKLPVGIRRIGKLGKAIQKLVEETKQLEQLGKGVKKVKKIKKIKKKGGKVIKKNKKHKQLKEKTKLTPTLTETLKNIFNPGGKLIGTQKGKNPSVRTISKEEAEKIIKQLMDAGATKVLKQPIGYEGTWYELPGGKGFGIRSKATSSSLKHGTTNTIDLHSLDLEIIKIKY